MSIKIDQEIWLYVERLYIHCYGVESFKIFLKKFGIDYDNLIYKEFNLKAPPHQKPFYVFMSEPNYDFANFMQTIPSYKYLPILEKVVFDEDIIATRKDGWNYYGESIRNWHSKIIDALKIANVKIDPENKKLSRNEQEEYFESPDFLPYNFNDLFLDYIRKEINESYNNGQLLSVIILSRKLLEALTIRIMEVVFPKRTQKGYSESNHSLWFNKEKGRHHFFSDLIMNLKDNAGKFDEDKILIIEISRDMEKLRKKANAFVHSDYKIPDENHIKDFSIELCVSKIRKIYKKYCNP